MTKGRTNSLPLSERARVEIYIPDQPITAYQDLLRTIVDEFTISFGGCTVIRGLDGYYLSKFGQTIPDRISIVYTDTPFNFQQNMDAVAEYADKVRESAFKALDEEAILVAVLPVYHSD